MAVTDNIEALITATGTLNEINVTPGFYPVISIANNPILPGTEGVSIPEGTTLQRGGPAGTIRLNTTNTVFEGTVDGATWHLFATGGDLVAGTNIAITEGAATITIAATGHASFNFTVVTTNTTMAPYNGYIANRAAGVCSFLLPAICPAGATIRISGYNANGWQIVQNAGQVIHCMDGDTTVGVTGTLASQFQYDAVELVCSVANTEFTMISFAHGPAGFART